MTCCGSTCLALTVGVIAVAYFAFKKFIASFDVIYPAVNSGAVVITGASTGIGADAAVNLAKKGFKVYAGVRKTEDGQKLVDSAGKNLIPLIIDVTKRDTITAAAKRVEEEVGSAGIVGLVNNAGINTQGAIEFQDVDEFKWQFEVNVFGQIAVTQAFMPLVRKAKGRIVNVSSTAGFLTAPLQGAYSGSKRALEAVTDALRLEVAPWKISVSSINPGFIETEILRKAREVTTTLPGTLSETQKKYYGPFFDNFKPLSPRLKGEVSLTTDAIVHALTDTRPKTRYVVGSPAFLKMITGWYVMPDRVLDYILAKKVWPGKAKIAQD